MSYGIAPRPVQKKMSYNKGPQFLEPVVKTPEQIRMDDTGKVPISRFNIKPYNVFDNTIRSATDSLKREVENKAVAYVTDRVKTTIKNTFGFETWYWNYFEASDRPIIVAINIF